MPEMKIRRFVSFAAGALLLTGLFAGGRQENPSRAPVLAWDIQKSGSEASLRGVSAVDENVAWASGSQGAVLRTSDGGKTWQSVPVPGMSRTDFRDIEALGPDTALVMAIGRPGMIFRTSDGGQSWTEVYHNDSQGIFLDAIAFADANNGWGIGDPMDGRFFLISTTDGGNTWRDLPPAYLPSAAAGEGAFAASGTSLAVRSANEFWFCTGGPVSRVFHTADAGRSWSVAASALLSGQPSFGAFGIAFLDGDNGLAVGGDYKNEPAAAKCAAYTSDGGKTWISPGAKPPAGFRECVAFVPGTSPALAMAVGPTGSDFSLDMGKTWRPIPAGPVGFHGFSVAKNGRCGWAVGRGGIIARIRF